MKEAEEQAAKVTAELAEAKKAAATAAAAPAAASTKVHESASPSKKRKAPGDNDWDDHAMNIEDAVMKAAEMKFLSEIAKGDLSILQGIGPKGAKILEEMRLKTIQDLAGAFFVLVSQMYCGSILTMCGSRPQNLNFTRLPRRSKSCRRQRANACCIHA